MSYFKLILFLFVGNILIAQVACQEEEANVATWVDYIEALQSQRNGTIPPPFRPVKTLVFKYLKQPCTVLDIGCETGKNSAFLIKHGHKVVMLDIAPNAIYYTMENLKREGLDQGIQESIVSSIEELPYGYGPFKAVVGTYAFSFIPPHLFEQTMKENVLNRVEHGGYFVGGFFGKEHAWAANPELTILTVEQLEFLFHSQGFSILEISELIQEVKTPARGLTTFHTIHVISERL